MFPSSSSLSGSSCIFPATGRDRRSLHGALLREESIGTETGLRDTLLPLGSVLPGAQLANPGPWVYRHLCLFTPGRISVRERKTPVCLCSPYLTSGHRSGGFPHSQFSTSLDTHWRGRLVPLGRSLGLAQTPQGKGSVPETDARYLQLPCDLGTDERVPAPPLQVRRGARMAHRTHENS